MHLYRTVQDPFQLSSLDYPGQGHDHSCSQGVHIVDVDDGVATAVGARHPAARHLDRQGPHPAPAECTEHLKSTSTCSVHEYVDKAEKKKKKTFATNEFCFDLTEDN